VVVRWSAVAVGVRGFAVIVLKGMMMCVRDADDTDDTDFGGVKAVTS